MRRVVISFILLLFVFSATAYAAVNGTYKDRPIVRVFVDGKEVQSAVPGQIVDGSTMLPLRAIAEALGADVTWDQATYSANIKLTAGLSLDELFKIGESVPVIYSLDENGYYTVQGSGFVYDGLVVTNYHVVKDAVKLDVRFGSHVHQIPPDLVYENPEADLAAFRLPGYTSLRLASDVPKIGEKVYVLGYPDDRFRITEGTIKSFETKDGYEIIWSTALARPGNSGGAMINSKGEIIGLVRGTDGVHDRDSFALHLNHLMEELGKIK